MNYTEFYSNKKRFIVSVQWSYLFDLFIENICYNVNQTLITFVYNPQNEAFRLSITNRIIS